MDKYYRINLIENEFGRFTAYVNTSPDTDREDTVYENTGYSLADVLYTLANDAASQRINLR